MSGHLVIWIVSALAIAGVIIRPAGLPEAVFAVAGAVLLLVLGEITPAAALRGVARGLDVYLFLAGMMLLSEVARTRGLFDWLAAYAARQAGGSAARLFALIYGVGIVVTMFLSNDATAVVLTPAVAAAARAAKARDPLPYLLACAFIANAASFVLPISNPANLVVYHSAMPRLLAWLAQYLLPSIAAILATYAVLRFTQRASLHGELADPVALPVLSSGGRTAAAGIAGTAILLLGASAFGFQLGPPTAAAGALTAAIVLGRERAPAWPLLRGISWSVLVLVAGLFVLVQALQQSGVIAALAALLRHQAQGDSGAAAWVAGAAVALASNLMNNLPVGLIAGSAVQAGQIDPHVTGALLIGVDLGPNLSVTGSLATILWLTALRREGIAVSAWRFLKIGALVMPPALLAALA
ncbi:MAG: arsenic transporter, partial [Acidocella sp. 20-61-6]